MKYSPFEIEKKWQQKWEEEKIFKFKDTNSPKKYVLEMFPYPSGKLHMGHVRNYTLGDVYARFQGMKGFNVLHPMGFDAFGLPAENAAIEHNVHPSVWTYKNIELMKEGMASIGISHDFTGDVVTCNPDYYKHEQEMFIDFLERNLAYKKDSYVNWDPVDMTVLANEQVVDGKGWRSGAVVERKKLSQWFLRITDFADDLLDSLDKLTDWPENVKSIQRKWIGRSVGAMMKFQIENSSEYLEIFSTRPDTIYGASFIVIAAAHPLALKLAEDNQEIANFVKEMENSAIQEEEFEKTEKKGIDTGLSAIVPITGKKVPIYVASYVLMEYGTGAVFGCPAHDVRDYEFAKKYGLNILQVVEAPESHDFNYEAYTMGGKIINSPEFNGLSVEEAIEKAKELLEKTGTGKETKMYRLRDWGVSRQRYWGCPIPIIYCVSCGAVPVPKKDLPVKLPEDVDFSIPGNPLDRHPTWKHVNCPKCHAKAVRETDTFDTFFESSWYFARFCSPLSEKAFDKELVEKLLPVDKYIGGIEHAAMHLLYARFFTKALTKCGYFNLSEPFKGLITQGMVLHATYKDAEGKWLFPKDAAKMQNVQVGRIEKMSKSKKNLVEPDEIIQNYGADAARLFMMSDNPPEKDFEWTDSGVEGAYKFLSRLYRYAYELAEFSSKNEGQPNKSIYKLVRSLEEHYENFEFNSAVARIREIWNIIAAIPLNAESFSSCLASYKLLLIVSSPIIPHLADELWNVIGEKNILFKYEWPRIDPSLCEEDEVTIAVQVNGKLRDTITVSKNVDKEALEKMIVDIPKVKQFIADKQVKKIIIVPGKVCNVVI